MTVKYHHEDSIIIGKKYKANTTFKYHIAIPETDKPLGIYIGFDGENCADEDAILKLANEKKAPYCVCIGILPGTLEMHNGTNRDMRLDQYDLFISEFANFLVYELIPEIKEKYSLNLVDSPDWRMISGGSSGGIMAFLTAWFHPEMIHRVYMSSPSFLAMGRGNEIPNLIRKYETKPLRIYQEYSEFEPNDYFGSSYCAALESKMALEFAEYDFNCKYFPDEGHCSRRCDYDEAYIRMQWLWNDYLNSPIKVKSHSPRVKQIIPTDSIWEKASSMPTDSKVNKYVVSSDALRKYYGTINDDVIHSVTIDENGNEIGTQYLHGILHTIPEVWPKGAIDLTIDATDRLYVLTSIGIQCVRSYGLIDVILDLPDDTEPEMIDFGKETDEAYLYVKTKKNIWRRKTYKKAISNGPSQPENISYYD